VGLAHSAFSKRYTAADADAKIPHLKTQMEDARQNQDFLKGAADRIRQFEPTATYKAFNGTSY